MKKFIFVVIFILLLVGFISLRFKSENSKINLVSKASSLANARIGASSVMLNIQKHAQTQVISASEQATINQIINFVNDKFPDSIPSNKLVLNSINDYLINTFSAINSTDRKDIIQSYKDAYSAMSCSMYFIQNPKDKYEIFKNIDALMSQNQEISLKRNFAERQVSGTVFADVSPNMKKVVCNDKYNK